MEPIPDGMMLTFILAIIGIVGSSIGAVYCQIRDNRRKHKKQ